MFKGIDVSSHNGVIDWGKVAGRVQFAMLRAGYGQYVTQKDVNFEYNYNQAKKHGIPVGCYWYSYAKNSADAKREAETFLQVIKGKSFEYPVCYDVEESKIGQLGKQVVSDIVLAFCDTVEKAGYYVSIYANRSWLDTLINDECKKRFDVWLAEWTNNDKPKYSGNYGMWQYSSDGQINGINGRVDLDYSVKNYVPIISKLNSEKVINDVKTETEIAIEVLNGKWGNGDERINKLTKAGYNYASIQSKINVWYNVARDVIKGKYGNGEVRKQKLKTAGFDYDVIQKIVNEII